MKRPSALTAGLPSVGTVSGSAATSHGVEPIVSAWASTRESDVCPMPRLGELAIRVNAPPSARVDEERQVRDRRP